MLTLAPVSIFFHCLIKNVNIKTYTPSIALCGWEILFHAEGKNRLRKIDHGC